MGYELEALVAAAELLRPAAAKLTHAHAAGLSCGLALLPLTHGLFEEIGRLPGRTPAPVEAAGSDMLTPAVEAWAAAVSRGGPITFVSASYFGGVGGQFAVVWRGGARAAGPMHAPDAINVALRELGVRAAGGNDEFDTVGLGSHRKTEAWAATAMAERSAADPAGAVAGLIRLLSFESADRTVRNRTRATAESKLGEMGPAAAAAIPALTALAEADEDYGVRLGAMSALEKIGQTALPTLIRLLERPGSPDDRWGVAHSLGRMGSVAAAAVPALVRALADPDYRVRAQAAESIRDIGPAAAEAADATPGGGARLIDALVAALDDKEWPVRSNAAKALGVLGPPAASALPALRRAMQDEDMHVRSAAAAAVQALAPTTQD